MSVRRPSSAHARGYDANGNTLTRGGETYGWDYENRMTSISGTASATYRYDYQGRRTSKSVAGVTTTYLYDGLNLLTETGASYLYGPGIDEPLAVTRNGAIAYYATDGLGSVVLLADASGAVANSYAYDAWGVPRATSETIPQPLRYTAREVGEVAGQYFYRARYYGAGVGRFLSEDPLGKRYGIVSYGYANSDPASNSDAFGLFATPEGCDNSPFDKMHVKSEVQKLCKVKLPTSKCQAAMRNASRQMFGDPNKLPNCMRRMCDGKMPLRCVSSCGDCGRSSASEGIVIGSGNAGCPAAPPNRENRFQQGPGGGPVGAGATIFHESMHWCLTGAEPYNDGIAAAYFRHLEKRCYDWRDPNAPRTGAP